MKYVANQTPPGGASYAQSYSPRSTGDDGWERLSIHELLRARVAASPEATALRFEGITMSYGDLDRRSNQLARLLGQHGVGREDAIIVCMDRSLELLVALYGVLKAGAYYVPIAPATPVERINMMVRDVDARIALTRSIDAPEFEPGVTALCVDSLGPVLADMSDQAPAVDVEPEQLAYVIYTSGSTGTPKGTMLSHAAACHFLSWYCNVVGIEAGDRVMLKTPITFDVSVPELFGSLARGATLVIARPDGHKDPNYLRQLITTEEITHVHFVPSMFRAFLAAAPSPHPSLRNVEVGGEALTGDLVDTHFSQQACPLINLYGPTEAAVWVTHGHMSAGEAVTLGAPARGCPMYVLDAELERVPAGTMGDLYIGGIQLARGYHGQPGLTAGVFLPDPFTGRPGDRMYKTGDLAQFRPDGAIEFFGRSDHQVKVRGHRIELGEIEAHALKHEGVSHCVVNARSVEGDTQLVAYVVVANDAVTKAELRDHLAAAVPAYMVPSAFVFLDGIPLNTSGKVDRRCLPAPEREDLVSSEEFVAPRSADEVALAAIWRDAFKLPEIGVRDDFLELGGHSLVAARVVGRVRSDLGVSIELKSLFEHSTIESLASHVAVLRDRGAGDSSAPVGSIVPVPREPAIEPTPAQMALKLFSELSPDSVAYHIPIGWRIRGPLDADVLSAAVDALTARHEALRTSLACSDGRTEIKVSDATPGHLRRFDLSGLDDRGRMERVKQISASQMNQPFDLGTGPLWRCALLELGGEEHLLLVTMHHIISDGWSAEILWRDLCSLYRAKVSGDEAGLPALEIQFADYAAWQRSPFAGRAFERQLAFWKKQLLGAPAEISLPRRGPRPPAQTYGGRRILRPLSGERTEALRALSRSYGSTLFMSLSAAIRVLLARYSGQREICLGSPVANRNHDAVENAIGYFVNMVVLRGHVDAGDSFVSVLARERETSLEAYSNADVPFPRVVEALGIERELSRTPVFQVMYAHDTEPEAVAELGPDLSATEIDRDLNPAQFDLTIRSIEQGDQLMLSFIYNEDLFEPWLMEQLADHLDRLLERIVEQPTARLSTLTVLSRGEVDHLLGAGDRRADEAHRFLPLHEQFEAQVSRNPDAVALQFRRMSISYAELNGRANQVAHHLRTLGVGCEDAVLVVMDRSIELLVALYGVLKSGGYYVPVSPSTPTDRVRFMARDVSAKVILTTSSEQPDVWDEIPCVCLDSDWAAVARQSDRNPRVHVRPEGLMYVIYTSGSTGEPKGTMLPNLAVNHFFEWYRKAVDMRSGDRVLLKTPTTFDVSTPELFATLAVGATIVVAEPDGHRDPRYLRDILDDEGITHVHFVPSMFRAFLDAAPRVHRTLRNVEVGGEALTADLVEDHEAQQQCPLINLYGPTEAAVWVTYGQMRAAEGVTIGWPAPGCPMYVLDADLNLVPKGVAGDLYIGGAQLARGYRGRASQTADCFIPDPFVGQSGRRMYRTGDRARLRHDKSIEFLGRSDFQVKVRGFRIELGEIESVLSSHELVAQCVVHTHDTTLGKRLTAYVVLTDERGDVSELREHLTSLLPDYMVPSAFVVLAELPLNASGKVDRKALPAPDRANLTADQAMVEPKTEREFALASVWKRLLGLNEVGIRDNFFELGGHSLLAVQLAAEVRRRFDVELEVATIFRAPTIERLAATLALPDAQVARRIPRSELDGSSELISIREGIRSLPVSDQQLHWIARRESEKQLLRAGAPVSEMSSRMLFGLRLKGELVSEVFGAAFHDVVRRHESLRTRFVNRPTGYYQEVLPASQTGLKVVDLSSPYGETRSLDGFLKSIQHTPLDRERGALFHAWLIRLAPEDHVLACLADHIVCDAWSVAIIYRDLSAAYNARLAGEQLAMATPVQPIDLHAALQAQPEKVEAAREYWRERLKNPPPGFLHPQEDGLVSCSSTWISADHCGELLDSLSTIATSEHCSPFVVLLALYGLHQHLESGLDEVLVNYLSAGRDFADVGDTVGCLVGGGVTRIRPIPEQSFRQLVAKVWHDYLRDQERGTMAMPGSMLPESGLTLDFGSRTLSSLLNAQLGFRLPQAHFEGLESYPVDLPEDVRSAEFHHQLLALPDTLRVYIDPDLVSPEEAADALGRLRELLRQVVASPDLPIARLSVSKEGAASSPPRSGS